MYSLKVQNNVSKHNLTICSYLFIIIIVKNKI